MSVYILGVCGGSGTGKTTFARCLRNELGEHRTIIISQDSYYRDLSHLDHEARMQVNFDHPKSIEFPLLVEHLRCLKVDSQVMMPVYDFTSHTRVGGEPVPVAEYVILEGHLIYHDENIRDILDLKVFLEHDIDMMLIRRILRDTRDRGRTFEQVVDQYLESVRPMYFQYVAPCRQWADITIRAEGAFDKHLSCIMRQITGE